MDRRTAMQSLQGGRQSNPFRTLLASWYKDPANAWANTNQFSPGGQMTGNTYLPTFDEVKSWATPDKMSALNPNAIGGRDYQSMINNAYDWGRSTGSNTQGATYSQPGGFSPSSGGFSPSVPSNDFSPSVPGGQLPGTPNIPGSQPPSGIPNTGYQAPTGYQPQIGQGNMLHTYSAPPAGKFNSPGSIGMQQTSPYFWGSPTGSGYSPYQQPYGYNSVFEGWGSSAVPTYGFPAFDFAKLPGLPSGTTPVPTTPTEGTNPYIPGYQPG